MSGNNKTGSFPDMDELLGGGRPLQLALESELQPEIYDDPRGNLERTSLQLYTKHRDKIGAMAFLKRVNIYDVLADALDEYFESHKDELCVALTLQSDSNRLQRGRPRKKR